MQSTFLDNLSSPRAPIAIYPAEEAAKAANQINFIGTGPFRFVEYKPDSHVKLARSTATCPTRNGTGRDGFAGKKEVLIDTVTFRFMPEAGARNAALEAGEVHLIETVDGPTAKRLEANKNFTVYKVLPFAFQVIKFNHAQAPTDDVNFRLAVQAALDMEEIMAIAYPDIYQMDPAWLYPEAAVPHRGRHEQVQQGRSRRGQGAPRASRATRARSSPSSSTTSAPTSTPRRSCSSA